jgi:hypothetical protein
MHSSYAGDVQNGRGGVLALMARTLKSQGRVELQELIKRVRRQLALNRISETDATFIVELLLKADERIVRMRELDEQGNPEEIVK